MEKEILLKVVTPDGKAAETVCDSVRFSIPDGDGGVKGGGVGIRKGHIDSLMSVAAGKLVAHKGGVKVLDCTVSDGLAVVSGDRLDILIDSAEIQ